MSNHRISNFRGAPTHVRKYWGRTGLEPAIFRLVELGMTWDDAHTRLKTLWEKFWDKGGRAKFTSPHWRFAQRVIRARILADYDSGRFNRHEQIYNGVRHVAVSNNKWGSSFVRARGQHQ